MSHIHGLDLSKLGIASASSVTSSVSYRYFIVVGGFVDGIQNPSLPVRVVCSKVDSFYSDYPSSDYVVFEVSSDTKYRCSCGAVHSIVELF
jgi:hypothetical protein